MTHTEHNLDLEFNSLDAQRESCEAYIKSQLHGGWRLPMMEWCEEISEWRQECPIPSACWLWLNVFGITRKRLAFLGTPTSCWARQKTLKRPSAIGSQRMPVENRTDSISSVLSP
jgi:hypothetical protein